MFKAQQARINSLAKSTRSSLETHLRSFLYFCTYLSLTPFPVVSSTLTMYIQYLGENMRAPGTIKNYVFGLQTLSQLKEWSFPVLTNAMFRMQFKGIARSLAHTPKRATPMCPPTLVYLSQFFDFTSSYEASMWAVIVVGFFMFSRISNLLPPKKGWFDRNKQLLKSDVKVSSDSVIIVVKWSKVIQLSERQVTLPLKSIPGSPICPKTALLNATRLAKSKDSDHLFSYRENHVLSTITQSEFISFLRKKLKSSGLNPNLYSGHSLRRGGGCLLGISFWSSLGIDKTPRRLVIRQ